MRATYLLLIAIIAVLTVPLLARAQYNKFAPNQSVTIGEFVYEDDLTASADDCTITVKDPTGATAVNNATMSKNADGWHYYTFTPANISGIWPAIMVCNDGNGDNVRADKTFTVGLTAIDEDSVAAKVWSYSTRTLSSFGTLVADIWGNGTRTLTSIGSLAADIWNGTYAPTRRLTDSTLTGGGSLGTESFLTTSLNAATTTITDEILTNRGLINALNNISAADVWAYGTRSLNTDVNISTASQQAIWDTATTNLSANNSIGKLLVDNLDAQVSTRGTSNLTAADVWNAATRTLTDYSENSLALAVWANSARTLTNYGNDITAQEVWDVLTSSLTQVGSVGSVVATNLDAQVSTRASLISQESGWTVKMSDLDRVQAGATYRAKVAVLNFQSAPTNSSALPTITVYDPDRNLVVSNINMTAIGTGLYEYTYAIANAATQGLWESTVSTEVEAGKIIQTNDYWEVAGSPAQVLINNITDATTPTISANVTITNEGLTGYEYQYEWCVVDNANNACGGNNDIFHATAAKFINPGEDFNTNLNATVNTVGNYIFKLVVYFGTDSSSASQTFSAIADSTPPPSGGGGGGGTVTPPPTQTCQGADFNIDTRINSIDFSILLAFWKTAAPFRNPCVDINHDSQVDSVDFSILLYQWKP